MNYLERVDMLYWLLAEDSSLSSSSISSSSSSSSSSSTTSTSSSSISSCSDIEIDDIESNSRMSTTELISDEKRGWQFDNTTVLINSVAAHYDELSHPTKKKHVWQNVCNELVSQHIEVTPLMCSKKWYNLVRSYKVCKNIKNKSGRGPVRFQFFDTLDNLLGRKCANASAVNIPTSNVQNEETEESSENQVTKRKCSFRKEYLMKKAEWKKRRLENYEEKMELKKMQLEMKDRKLKALEALVQRRNTK